MICALTATGDSTYIEIARTTFLSFRRLRGDARPWTVFEDSCGCYWVEEYPAKRPSRTLNGFIAAVLGLYDYYQLTGDEVAGATLADGLSTLKNYIPCYRRPGKPSFYGLTFGHYEINYHRLHIRQIRMLHRMTGDPFFSEWADSFARDLGD